MSQRYAKILMCYQFNILIWIFTNSIVDPNQLCSDLDPDLSSHARLDPELDLNKFGSGSDLNVNFLEIEIFAVVKVLFLCVC